MIFNASSGVVTRATTRISGSSLEGGCNDTTHQADFIHQQDFDGPDGVIVRLFHAGDYTSNIDKMNPKYPPHRRLSLFSHRPVL
jgi:hypothetical protein